MLKRVVLIPLLFLIILTTALISLYFLKRKTKTPDASVVNYSSNSSNVNSVARIINESVTAFNSNGDINRLVDITGQVIPFQFEWGGEADKVVVSGIIMLDGVQVKEGKYYIPIIIPTENGSFRVNAFFKEGDNTVLFYKTKDHKFEINQQYNAVKPLDLTSLVVKNHQILLNLDVVDGTFNHLKSLGLTPGNIIEMGSITQIVL